MVLIPAAPFSGFYTLPRSPLLSLSPLSHFHSFTAMATQQKQQKIAQKQKPKTELYNAVPPPPFLYADSPSMSRSHSRSTAELIRSTASPTSSLPYLSDADSDKKPRRRRSSLRSSQELSSEASSSPYGMSYCFIIFHLIIICVKRLSFFLESYCFLSVCLN